jgi:glycosyltransferase involved in cell wall biosynthesis
MKIAIVANTAWYLYNFRLNLARALRDAGHESVFISPADPYAAKLQQAGFVHRHWPLSGAGKNPLSELRSILDLRKQFRKEKPGAVLSFTPKGNIYSGLALLGCPGVLVPNISGLGGVFSAGGPLAALVRGLYRLAIARRASHVFFQNEEDMAQFAAAGIAEPSRAERLMGSGVDLKRFPMRPLPSVGGQTAVTFLLVARLIPEKGIPEYVDAARALHKQGARARFQLLGAPADERGLSLSQVRAWHDEGAIEYLGTSDDVPEVMAHADCLVLPSYYREGVPRSLIEGAAMGRPVITTDMPGCRDVVEPGINGWICQPRSVESLQKTMQAFLDMPASERSTMGRRSRQKVEAAFSEESVLRRYEEILAWLGRTPGAIWDTK